MNYKSVLLALSLIILTTKSEAVTVEVAQWIPWRFVEQELQNLPLSFELQPRDVTLQWQDWHPLLIGASLNVHGAWTQLQVQSSGISAESKGLSAHLQVEKLVIDQTIVKEVGGHRVEIQVKATCEPFEINIPGADLFVQAQFQKRNELWSPLISQLKLAVHEDWSVSPLACHGPQGFEKVLTELLQDSLKNSNSISSLLQNFFATTLDQKWSELWGRLTMIGDQNLKLLSMEDPTELGLFFRGEIQSGENLPRFSLSSPLQTSQKSNTPQLVLTSDGFMALAKEKATHFAVTKYNLQNISSFKSLMRSRFKQFFLWPDLMNFPKSSPFWLSSKPSQKIDLQALGHGKWKMQSQTAGVIEAQRHNRIQPYLHWGLGASYRLSTQVKDSVLQLHVDQSKTNMIWSFDSNYVKQYRPHQRTPKSILKKVGDSLFTGRSLDVPLPILNLKSKTLKLNNWIEDRDLIWMEWK